MKIFWHWNNAGCFGVRFRSGLYIDVFRRPSWGMFITNGRIRVWAVFGSATMRVETPENTRMYKAVLHP